MINDMKSNAYFLKPGDEIEIDKPSPRDTVILINKVKEKKSKKKGNFRKVEIKEEEEIITEDEE